jgi:hypothetical protein
MHYLWITHNQREDELSVPHSIFALIIAGEGVGELCDFTQFLAASALIKLLRVQNGGISQPQVGGGCKMREAVL